MVWGYFSAGDVGAPIEVKGTMDEFAYQDVLRDSMLLHAKVQLDSKWLFQQDGDPRHTSVLMKQYPQNVSVKPIEWLSQSPDLNPVDHLWKMVDRRLKRHKVCDKYEFWRQLQDEWAKIPDSALKPLVQLMPRRCSAMIQAKSYTSKCQL